MPYGPKGHRGRNGGQPQVKPVWAINAIAGKRQEEREAAECHMGLKAIADEMEAYRRTNPYGRYMLSRESPKRKGDPPRTIRAQSHHGTQGQLRSQDAQAGNHTKVTLLKCHRDKLALCFQGNILEESRDSQPGPPKQIICEVG
jgi:hypothetical protein